MRYQHIDLKQNYITNCMTSSQWYIRPISLSTSLCTRKPHLEDVLDGTLPRRHGSRLCALGVDVVPVKLSPASVDIDLVEREPSLALPEVTADPEEANDEEGEVRVEELVCSANLLPRRRDSDVELCRLADGLSCAERNIPGQPRR